MDSKPIAIIIAIVITIGAMGAVIVTSTNILSGTSGSNDLLLKSVDVISVSPTHLQVTAQIINQGWATIDAVNAYIEIDGIYRYRLTVSDNGESYKTLSAYGGAYLPFFDSFLRTPNTIHSVILPFDKIGNFAGSPRHPTTVDGKWDVYPGETILLRINATTTSGDQIEKLHTITVK